MVHKAKQQNFIGGIAFNGPVNELPDGSANCDMCRDIAHMLKIPNADKLTVSAATSDSAST